MPDRQYAESFKRLTRDWRGSKGSVHDAGRRRLVVPTELDAVMQEA